MFYVSDFVNDALFQVFRYLEKNELLDPVSLVRLIKIYIVRFKNFDQSTNIEQTMYLTPDFCFTLSHYIIFSTLSKQVFLHKDFLNHTIYADKQSVLLGSWDSYEPIFSSKVPKHF